MDSTKPSRPGASASLTRLALGITMTVLSSITTVTSAHADGDNDTVIPNNKRLNDDVVSGVYTVQHQAGCKMDVRINRQLRLAAQRHTEDLLNNPNLDGDIGSNGSTVQNRARDAGYPGPVAETVYINQSLAMNNLEVVSNWYYRPDYNAIMSNCTFTQMGVWSLNSLNRSVLVAVYGQPV
jgi:uncharacterized protein YkwD